MDKRQTDRLTVNPITKQLIDFVIDKWIERVIRSIQYQDKYTSRAVK